MNFINGEKCLLNEDLAEDGTRIPDEVNGKKAKLAVTWRAAEYDKWISSGLENR